MPAPLDQPDLRVRKPDRIADQSLAEILGDATVASLAKWFISQAFAASSGSICGPLPGGHGAIFAGAS